MADGGGRQAYHDATVGPPSLRIARREGGPRLPVVLGVPLAGGELSARRCSSCWSVANGAGRCEARRVRGRRGAGECGALIEGAPAIALEGPKGVGKTVSAARRAVSVVALDDPMQRDLLDADPDRLERGPHPILLDEWQRFPRSWDLVRRSVDANRGAGRFLLTGSAVPPDVGVHTGAGRIVTLRMRPLALAERFPGTATVRVADLLEGHRRGVHGRSPLHAIDYAEEVVASGFPAIRATTGRVRRALLDGYVERIVERDFPAQGCAVRRPQALLAWLRAYAAAAATSASYQSLLEQ